MDIYVDRNILHCWYLDEKWVVACYLFGNTIIALSPMWMFLSNFLLSNAWSRGDDTTELEAELVSLCFLHFLLNIDIWCFECISWGFGYKGILSTFFFINLQARSQRPLLHIEAIFLLPMLSVSLDQSSSGA